MIYLNRAFRERLAELPAHERKTLLRAPWQGTPVRGRSVWIFIGGFGATTGLLVLQEAGVLEILPQEHMVLVWFGFVLASLHVALWKASRDVRAALVRDRPEICGRCGGLAGPADPCPACGTPRGPGTAPNRNPGR